MKLGPLQPSVLRVLAAGFLRLLCSLHLPHLPVKAHSPIADKSYGWLWDGDHPSRLRLSPLNVSAALNNGVLSLTALETGKASANNGSAEKVRNRSEKVEHQKNHPAKPSTPKPVFSLYVSGATSKSIKAVLNTKSALNQLFNGQFELRVIDTYQEPHKVRAARAIAVPLLIKEHPLPPLRVIGDLYSKGDIRCLLSGVNERGKVGEQDGK